MKLALDDLGELRGALLLGVAVDGEARISWMLSSSNEPALLNLLSIWRGSRHQPLLCPEAIVSS
ncbi:MAG: hypothetical protein IPI63_00230 [Methanothrix sp.]|uniref:hypothetical protein n=1 Tax=Methanothrix sp. TaxID=90426 RepID=UPI001BD2CDC1|nr:hypothetical protein [Methanothrix sp.]MBK7385224.1 hypothetical protein [Methanothrix sp.]HPW73296.1 hypothetical protein [Methanothrix sp.]